MSGAWRNVGSAFADVKVRTRRGIASWRCERSGSGSKIRARQQGGLARVNRVAGDTHCSDCSPGHDERRLADRLFGAGAVVEDDVEQRREAGGERQERRIVKRVLCRHRGVDRCRPAEEGQSGRGGATLFDLAGLALEPLDQASAERARRFPVRRRCRVRRLVRGSCSIVPREECRDDRQYGLPGRGVLVTGNCRQDQADDVLHLIRFERSCGPPAVSRLSS